MEMKKISEAINEIPQSGKMNVPLRLYANDAIRGLLEESAYTQGMNVAMLPGIQKHSIMLPDTHFGYGFPIGGVAAFDIQEGIISPGGVGFDQNCGVRMITTNLTKEDIEPKLKELMQKLFRNVPSGVGSEGRLKINGEQMDEVAVTGAKWAVENGYGNKRDLEHMEESGCIAGANPDKVSDKAKKRGKPQLGTIGSGNHFLEVQYVDQIYDKEKADVMGVTSTGQAVIMLHCGSRGYGYQICDDYIAKLDAAFPKFGFEIPDRQLVCAPINSDEGRDYIEALNCGINYAFCNRQVMTQWMRETFEDVFKKTQEDMEMNLVYDVCHNIAKFEEHEVDGKNKTLCVHRKGATRSFPGWRKEVPKVYSQSGQPVLIPGSMGTASYLLAGAEGSLNETFGSTAHGAGRVSSRTSALRNISGSDVRMNLEKSGKIVFATSDKVIAEEAPQVYKDIDQVIESTELAGISKKVARMIPMGVTKG